MSPLGKLLQPLLGVQSLSCSCWFAWGGFFFVGHYFLDFTENFLSLEGFDLFTRVLSTCTLGSTFFLFSAVHEVFLWKWSRWLHKYSWELHTACSSLHFFLGPLRRLCLSQGIASLLHLRVLFQHFHAAKGLFPSFPLVIVTSGRWGYSTLVVCSV